MDDSLLARLARRFDRRGWTLTSRIVIVTVALSTVAVVIVGASLSSTIAHGLFEQRRDRVLIESREARSELGTALDSVKDSSAIQQQEAATVFVQSFKSSATDDGRQVALLPVDSSDTLTLITTDRALLDVVSADMRERVSRSDGLLWQSVLWREGTHKVPAIVVGTRVMVPGAGSYDLFILYPLGNEQETLDFVQQMMAAGGITLLLSLLGIALVVGRFVSVPIRETAAASERLAAGELETRIEVSGSDELSRLGQSFNAMATALQEKVEGLATLSHMQQRFVSDVSHELRTPLTTIRMASSVIDGAKDTFPSDVRRSAELMTTQVRRFDRLLSDLLEISRFDAGAAQLNAKREDLRELVELAIENIRPLAKERGCEVQVYALDCDMHACVDSRRIDRILRNLLVNAIEHGQGAPIWVHLGASEEAVCISVQDNGYGLSPEAAQRVFDRFWRADPSRARTLGGSGLGLSISLTDAHLHGGWLQAWGKEGRGAVFRLTLPREEKGTLRDSPLPLERGWEDPKEILNSLSCPQNSTPTQTGPADLPTLFGFRGGAE
ncbi:MtrAB system histidine kinase MtrB [Dermabacteraceae bacterium P13115]|nr:HAMP domain-containing histidine kinase [Dermabacteraceae bacterium TAE3-ERU5]